MANRFDRERLAEMLMQDTQGLDDAPSSTPKQQSRNPRTMSNFDFDASAEELFGADGGPLDKVSDLYTVGLRVAAGAALNVVLFQNAHYDLAALPTGMIDPSIDDYKEMVRYVHTAPMIITNIQIISSEPTSGGPVINSLKLIKEKKTPTQSTLTNARPISSLRSSQDYQSNVFNIGQKFMVDTWNYFRLTTGTNPLANPAVDLTVNITIGARVDLKRLLAPVLSRVQPTTARPGQLGQRPVGQ